MRLEARDGRSCVYRLRGLYHEISLNEKKELVLDGQGEVLLAFCASRHNSYFQVLNSRDSNRNVNAHHEWQKIEGNISLDLGDFRAEIVSTSTNAESQSKVGSYEQSRNYRLELYLGNYSRYLPIPMGVPLQIGRDERCFAVVNVAGVEEKHCTLFEDEGTLLLRPNEGNIEYEGSLLTSETQILPKAGTDFRLLPGGLKCAIHYRHLSGNMASA